MTENEQSKSEDGAGIVCPTCGNDVAEVESETRDDPGVDFTVANGGEIVSAWAVTLVEYTFQPCGHTALGTHDRGDNRSLHAGATGETE
ncbi:hypothetical protein [Natrinema versiforme]|uniref:Uncharacterized protein n=1 Tax=Natrinema versiforme JCM 10478 TaxID=1227496 RepID=L9Y4A7_9EURY|nr:hypothetical protein [Natrinema versiforme]ELY68919.1 hypothetical protein C489_06118 [Natrinema versiforme JCM 10478]